MLLNQWLWGEKSIHAETKQKDGKLLSAHKVWCDPIILLEEELPNDLKLSPLTEENVEWERRKFENSAFTKILFFLKPLRHQFHPTSRRVSLTTLF